MIRESDIYELRLFDQVLIVFRMSRGEYGDLSVEVLSTDSSANRLLPLSFAGEATDERLFEWIRRRRIPKNRAYVDEILKSCGIESDDAKSIIDVSKGLSLNDSYWVVPQGLEGTFAEWNLYENEMSTALQLVAYTGVASDALADGGIPSELTNSGMFPKAWRARGSKRFLYKAGHLFEGANVGKEPYSEYLASQIAYRIGIDAVPYDLALWRGKLCSTCELFCSKDVAFVPFGFAVSSERFKNMNLREALAYFAGLGEGELEKFKSMLVFDALICNEDRHMGNYGVLRDGSTGVVQGMAPLFDHNMALFAGAMPDELNVGAMMGKASIGRGAFAPSLDEQAALVIGPVQKQQLERLDGFAFERHSVMDEFEEGDTRNFFSDERISILNDYVARRAETLLALPTVDPEKILGDIG
ncbi:HipA domain-containing protein [Arabiibacter massiliensis]|uniref:hypothetical protein n=1 Tax=Arabiibacter massiliensis TaxID=1870985 RepID=UPI0009BA00B2|nr:hypothetical protein [Arabiibacter massiliensis]